MDRSDVMSWVRRYREAWESNERDEIRDLFAQDARYWTAPFREPWTGAEAIADGWLDRKDEPGDTEFDSEVVAVDGDLGVVRATTRYLSDGESYSNLWLIRLDDEGRATEFVEYWMLHE